MTELDRRSLLTGAAAQPVPALLAPLATLARQGHGAARGTQNAGWYRYKVGTHEVTVVTDGVARFKFPDGFVANKSRDEVNRAWRRPSCSPAPDESSSTYTPIVVNTGSKLVVMDTGTGEANFERSKGAAGQFNNNLKAAGIDRNQVDTRHHLALPWRPHQRPADAGQQAAFPNAEILVPAAEWKYFMDDAEMGKQTSDRMKGVFADLRRVFDALGRKVTPYEPDKEWRRASPRWRPTAILPATTRTSSPRATARCTCRPTSPTSRCSCAIRAGT